jgi:anti-sigma regulatory factor (Ser/Thr protein kinase)
MPEVEHAALIADGFLVVPLRMRIQRQARDVGRARRWLRACLRHLPAPVTDAAEAVFAEVAANAVRHGRGRITVTVELAEGTVRCAVRDAGWRVPRPAGPWRPDLEDGRGMLIVAALADRWGVRRHLRGKTVWFEIPVPVRPRPARPGFGLDAAGRPGRSAAAFAKTALPPQ